MRRAARIAIIGGGIGGLTAARALRQRGFEPIVYEAAPELKEVGAGVALHPNATSRRQCGRLRGSPNISLCVMDVAAASSPRRSNAGIWSNVSARLAVPSIGQTCSTFLPPPCRPKASV